MLPNAYKIPCTVWGVRGHLFFSDHRLESFPGSDFYEDDSSDDGILIFFQKYLRGINQIEVIGIDIGINPEVFIYDMLLNIPFDFIAPKCSKAFHTLVLSDWHYWFIIWCGRCRKFIIWCHHWRNTPLPLECSKKQHQPFSTKLDINVPLLDIRKETKGKQKVWMGKK
jgi:hypothetical protein